MNNSPKIDLSAIMNKSNNNIGGAPKKVEEIHVPEKIEEEIEEKIESKLPHISIGTIKTAKSNEEKEEIKEEQEDEEHEDRKEELIETLNEYDNGLEENNVTIVKDENDEVLEEKDLDESIKEIEEKIDKKVEEETKEKFNIKEKELQADEKELFGNYKPDFKEKIIIEKINEKNRNFKPKLKKPKTRMILIISGIILTVSVVSGLFIFDPDHYSMDKYQKIISNNINKIMAEYIDKPWVSETISVDSQSFEIFTQEKLFSKVNYKYMDLVYKSKLELESVLKLEAKLIKETEIARLNAERAEKEAEAARVEAEIAKSEAETAKLEAEKTENEAVAIKTEKQKHETEIIKSILLNKFK